MQLYKAYIKNCLDLNGLPEAYVTVQSGSPSGDILTRASSSFEVLGKTPDEVKLGDIFCLYDTNGTVIYQGVISGLEYDKESDSTSVDTDSIYSYFNMNWFYRTFQEDTLEHEVADIFNDFIAHKIGSLVESLPEANETNWYKNQLYYKLETRDSKSVYVDYRISKEIEREQISGSSEYQDKVTYKMIDLGLSGCNNTEGATPEEFERDKMFEKKFNIFTVTYDGSQEVHLPVLESDGDMRNMEDFIYSLYADYGVIVEINIPYNSGCSINIKTANYDGTKIARNSANILSIVPSMETAETNKLMIFSSTGGFRGTYYATETGITDDSEAASRLKVINTEFVNSDDAIDDIKKEYLKDQMYDHQIVFELILKNNLYDFFSWNLGMPLEVYYDGAVYQSIYTGFEYSFDMDERPSTVTITCGKVRNKLTDLINMKKV